MQRVERPWGHFDLLWFARREGQKEPAAKLKILVVNPGQRTSLQRHAHRDEHWVVVSGEGTFVLDREQDVTHDLVEGMLVTVPRGTWHRIEARSKLVIAEVQIGECRKGDIERMEDDYGRTSEVPVDIDEPLKPEGKVACGGLSKLKDRG